MVVNKDKETKKSVNSNKESEISPDNKVPVVVKEEAKDIAPLGIPDFSQGSEEKPKQNVQKVIVKKEAAKELNPLGMGGIINEKDSKDTDPKKSNGNDNNQTANSTNKDEKLEVTKNQENDKSMGNKGASIAAGTAAAAGAVGAGAYMKSKSDEKDNSKKSEIEGQPIDDTRSKEKKDEIAKKADTSSKKMNDDKAISKLDDKKSKDDTFVDKVKTGATAAVAAGAGMATGAYIGAKDSLNSKNTDKKEDDKPKELVEKGKEIKGEKENVNSEHPKNPSNTMVKDKKDSKNSETDKGDDNKDKGNGVDKIKAGAAAAVAAGAGIATGAFVGAKSAMNKPDENKQVKSANDNLDDSKHDDNKKSSVIAGGATIPSNKDSNHVSIDENKNQSCPMNNRPKTPEKLENIPESSILNDLRKKNLIRAEGFIYKKREWFFCFWVQKYFILLKTGEMFYTEIDGTGEKEKEWNIKKAASIKKYDYEGYSHPYRLTFATDDLDAYFAVDSEADRDYWYNEIADTSRCN